MPSFDTLLCIDSVGFSLRALPSVSIATHQNGEVSFAADLFFVLLHIGVMAFACGRYEGH
jgi:hypothetical protein